MLNLSLSDQRMCIKIPTMDQQLILRCAILWYFNSCVLLKPLIFITPFLLFQTTILVYTLCKNS